MVEIMISSFDEEYIAIVGAIKNIIEDTSNSFSRFNSLFEIALKLNINRYWISKEFNALRCPWDMMVSWKIKDNNNIEIRLNIKNLMESKIDVIVYNIVRKEGN